jgi:hypothetical protein
LSDSLHCVCMRWPSQGCSMSWRESGRRAFCFTVSAAFFQLLSKNVQLPVAEIHF